MQYPLKQLFQYRNIFQNVVNALSKIVDTFLSKNLNLIQFGLSDNVQILLACGTNTYKGITNDIWDFPCQHFQRLHKKPLSEHQLFTLNFVFKLFHVSIAFANTRSPKYYLLFLNSYVYYKLAKFEQNQIIQTTQNLELFDKKPFITVAISDILLVPFWMRFLQWNGFPSCI